MYNHICASAYLAVNQYKKNTKNLYFIKYNSTNFALENDGFFHTKYKIENMAKEITKKKEVTETSENHKVMPFGKQNYILVLIGIALLVLGFILMIGGGSNDPDVFNEKMFDFQHITLSTILILTGFVVEIIAIFWKGKK